MPGGRTESGKSNGDRFGGPHLEVRHGTARPEPVSAPEVKAAADKAADGKTEAAAVNGGRQVPGKGRSRRRNVAQRAEDRPEAVITAHAQPAAPAADEAATAGVGTEDQEKTKQPHEKVALPQTIISAERGSDTLNPIVETVNREIIELIGTSITDLADENGWAFLGDVGTLIAKKKPDFDPRNYGFVKLTPLIRSLDMFELDIRETSQFHIKHVYVRNRKRSNE
jgi:Fe-S-cluster formation regulator IscX/YfhJ